MNDLLPNTEALFPYQKVGAQFLTKHRRALLADEMGVGKSAQAVHACDLHGTKRLVVACPGIARINWLREFEKFSYIKRDFKIIYTAKDEIKDTESVICSYDLIEKIAPKLKALSPWPVLILDEAHYLMNHDAIRTKAVFGREGIARKAHRVWALTGTPMPNHAGNLWVLFSTFGITMLSYNDFVDRYCEYYMHGPIKCITGTRPERIPELKYLLSQFTLRRLKVDVQKELPAIFFKDIVVEANEVDIEVDAVFVEYVYPQDRRKEFYELLAQERNLLEACIEKAGERSEEAPAVVSSIASCVPTLRRYTGMQKVKHVAELVKRNLTDKAFEKVVIFAVHQSVIEGLRRELKDYGVVTLYGKTPLKKRQQHIDDFQNNPQVKVFVANIQAAGTAITLTAAHHVYFIELDYSPGNVAQACMRVHRIGQTKPVTVSFISLANSVDEKVNQILRRKTKSIIELLDQQVFTTKESENISTRNEIVSKQLNVANEETHLRKEREENIYE